MNIGISAAYGFSNFYPSIVRGFGYNNTTTLLLTGMSTLVPLTLTLTISTPLHLCCHRVTSQRLAFGQDPGASFPFLR
jgi:hypothetical protein